MCRQSCWRWRGRSCRATGAARSSQPPLAPSCFSCIPRWEAALLLFLIPPSYFGVWFSNPSPRTWRAEGTRHVWAVPAGSALPEHGQSFHFALPALVMLWALLGTWIQVGAVSAALEPWRLPGQEGSNSTIVSQPAFLLKGGRCSTRQSRTEQKRAEVLHRGAAQARCRLWLQALTAGSDCRRCAGGCVAALQPLVL